MSSDQLQPKPAVPPAPPYPDEQTFLEEQGVLVTSARVVVGDRTFAVAGLTSVRQSRSAAPQVIAIILAVVAGIIGFGVIAYARESRNWTYGIPAVVPLAGCAVLGFGASKVKPVLGLHLTTAAGEQQALGSDDPVFMARVVNAVNSAIVSQARG